MLILEDISFCPCVVLVQLAVYSWQMRLAYLVWVEIELIL